MFEQVIRIDTQLYRCYAASEPASAQLIKIIPEISQMHSNTSNLVETSESSLDYQRIKEEGVYAL